VENVLNSGEQMAVLEVRLLGPLEAGVGRRSIELRRKKQRELLALLALRAGEVVSTDRLVDELWGESPPKAAVGSLQNLVSELRKVLPPNVLVTRAPGYVLELDRDAVDAHRFERLVREARDAPPEQRVTQLREALALWRGPALADVQLEHASADEAARLEELRLAAWEDRLGAELELGHHSQAIGELESFVSKHPLRERPIGLLMLALYRGGRQAAALDTFRQARESLVDELGINPSPELQRLERAILRQDSDLDLPQAALRRPSAPPQADRRKTVTMLFADLVGSTELADQLDPEVLRAVTSRYFDLVRWAVDRHGGIVEKFIGDAAMAAFGIPTQHEDDALRAVRSATDLRESLGELNEELAVDHGIALRMRIGLSTGEVLVADPGSGEQFATGSAVNLAMRLQQAALPGEILLGEPTYRLVRHAVDAESVDAVDLGALGRVTAFRLLGLGEAVRPLGTATLVGRADELAWLQAAFAGVQAERRSRVVTVLGDAGVGKTRLTSELVQTSGATALVGRCVSYGEGATYLPLAEIVRQAVPVRPRAAIAALLEGDEQAALIAERVTQLTGQAEGAASAGETFWAVKRFLDALAVEQPLIVVLEDIHWAEPTLLDLVEYLDAWTAEAPLLVVCLARRELLDERPGWGRADRALVLEPLASEDAGALVGEIAGDALDRAAIARIVQIAEGNPLFLEQLLALVEEAGPEALATVPPSVEALLAGRLDRLEPEERALLERAAVAGREFSRSALFNLTPPEELAAVDSRLASLVHRGLLRSVRAEREDAYRFHHVLVRDVAYAGITKEARADLHERYGSWLEQRDGPDEIVGYHLEHAHRYRSELRPGDPALTPLAKRAGDRLAEAGLRAWKQADTPATVNLLDRAAVLLDREDLRRAEVQCELGIAQRWIGDMTAGKRSLTEAITNAGAAADRQFELRARIELAHLELFTDRDTEPERLVQLVTESIPLFEKLGDDRALGRSWRHLGYVRGALEGRCAEWLRASERAAEHYRRSGWSDSGCLSEAAAALFYGPTPVPEAIARCRELLEQATDRVGAAHVHVYIAALLALGEQFDEARKALAEGATIYRDLGETFALANNSGRIQGWIELLAGDPQAAESVLSLCCETFRQVGDEAALSSAASELGRALYAQDRLEESCRWAALAEAHAPSGDIIAQFSWRGLRGRLLAHEHRLDEAMALVSEALEIVARTDLLTYHGDLLVDYAHVLSSAGRHRAAAAGAERALELFDLKENAASAEGARALLTSLVRA
jgi:class 3 adenylate cyclase/tetratricopeptide (TPR) repeat protein